MAYEYCEDMLNRSCRIRGRIERAPLTVFRVMYSCLSAASLPISVGIGPRVHEACKVEARASKCIHARQTPHTDQ